MRVIKRELSESSVTCSVEDVELLQKVENIVAVITWYDAPANYEEYKVFHITEEDLYIDWFCTNGKEYEMTNTYYEVIDTEISIEEVAKRVIRRECGAVTTFIERLESLRKGVVHYT